MKQNRDGDGRYSPVIEDDTILAAVVKHAPAATSEVADDLDLTRQAADYRLRQLRDRDAVASKKIGGSLAWFLGEESSAAATPDDREINGEADSSEAGESKESLDDYLPPADTDEDTAADDKPETLVEAMGMEPDTDGTADPDDGPAGE